jgi:hypothetical protein
MEAIGCPETSVTNYQYALRNIGEERGSLTPFLFYRICVRIVVGFSSNILYVGQPAGHPKLNASLCRPVSYTKLSVLN